MGIYLNPGNSSFQEIRNDLYIDKSGLIALINRTINTPQKLTCISRPRRFGKSYVAKMLCAYYDKTCDSTSLFDDLMISQDKYYLDHLNQYNVIYLDMTTIMGELEQDQLISGIKKRITEELLLAHPDLIIDSTFFTATLMNGMLLFAKLRRFRRNICNFCAPCLRAAQRLRKFLLPPT